MSVCRYLLQQLTDGESVLMMCMASVLTATTIGRSE